MVGFLHDWILTLLIVLPIVGAVAVAVMRRLDDPDADRRRISTMALGWSLLVLVAAVVMVTLFYAERSEAAGESAARWGGMALQQSVGWVWDVGPGEPATRGYLDIRYSVGVDGLSVWLVVLSALLSTLSIWASFTGIRTRVKEFYALMLLLEAAMIGVFCARDLLLFYVFFEFTLVPLFFIIAIWGGVERRFAAIKFFLYTFTGSMLMFAGILYLAYAAFSLPAEQGGVGRFTFDIDTLYRLQLSPATQWWLFLAFAIGFAVKVPLWPLHTWLPLAHTEAPTAGSVLLAGILLKLGTYGFLRFNLPMLPAASWEFAPLMAVLSIIGVIYAALAAWVQGDMKKLVAYSSVSHLGFCILGLFSLKNAGVTGSLLHMINHGLSTGALFLVVGMIYERYHTREFRQLGGLARRMPWLAFFLVFFSLASICLPGLNGFVSEFLVLLGTFTSAHSLANSPAGPLGVVYAVFAATGIILSAIYMLAMCQRVLFGPLVEPPHTPDVEHVRTSDLNGREIAVLTPLAVLCLIIGVYPKPLIDTIQPAAERHVLDYVFFEEPSQAPSAFVQNEPVSDANRDRPGAVGRLSPSGGPMFSPEPVFTSAAKEVMP